MTQTQFIKRAKSVLNRALALHKFDKPSKFKKQEFLFDNLRGENVYLFGRDLINAVENHKIPVRMREYLDK